MRRLAVVAIALLIASATPGLAQFKRTPSDAAGRPNIENDSPPDAVRTYPSSEPMSEAQIRELIGRNGYFQITDLDRHEDGTWTCRALMDRNRQEVTVVVDQNGIVAER